MTRRTRRMLATAALAMLPAAAMAQQPQQPTLTPLTVGTKAPDFSLVASTRTGIGNAIKLSDFHGKTIILAFFYRSRTRG